MSEQDLTQTTDADVFVPETRTVTIGNETFTVQKLTLRKWIEVSRSVTRFIGAVLKRFQSEHTDVSLDEVSWPLLLPYVWEELAVIGSVLGAAIDKDEEWMLKQTDMKGISSLLLALVELNDVKEVVRNFSAAYVSLKDQWKDAEESPSEPAQTCLHLNMVRPQCGCWRT